jgi:hypothetical protein
MGLIMKKGEKVIYKDKIYIIEEILNDELWGITVLIYNPNEYEDEFLNDILPKKIISVEVNEIKELKCF